MKKLNFMEGLKAATLDFANRQKPIFVISDLNIFEVLVTESIRKKNTDPADQLLFFDGKGAGKLAFETICQGSLFAQVPPIVLSLSNKYSVKFWKEEMGWLGQLPTNTIAPLVVFLPLSFRPIVPELEKSKVDSQLFWAPSQQREIDDAIRFLATHAFQKSGQNPPSNSQLKDWVGLAAQHYGSELEAVYGHFSNMASTGLNFEQCLMAGTDTGSFQVVDCLAFQNFEALALRLNQCKFNGENPSGILAAVCYFLKQLANVQDAVLNSQTTNPKGSAQVNPQQLKSAFDSLQIPFPSQSKIAASVTKIGPVALLHFFLAAPELEIQLRSSADPFGVLTLQLQKLYLSEP